MLFVTYLTNKMVYNLTERKKTHWEHIHRILLSTAGKLTVFSVGFRLILFSLL